MGWEASTTVGVVLLVLGLLAFTRAAPDLIFIGYETGIEVSDQQLACINCTPAAFHGEWNYTIRPRK